MNPVIIGNATLYCGDCRDTLKALPDNSIQCCVTSPPYFGLRDYGVAGQIGLEPTPDAYVAEMVAVFREVRRVLRDDGVCWLNLGDSYSGSWGNYGGHNRGNGTQRDIKKGSKIHQPSYDGLENWRPPTTNPPGLKPKDLIGIPWRVAFALQADGWYLRSEIIWHKPNPMPESVADRPTKSHEQVFLLTKSARYFYDAEAVKEAATSGPPGTVNKDQPRKMNSTPLYQSNRNGRTQEPVKQGAMGIPESGKRNRRSVWTIATTPFSGAHFAVMPPALVEPCILAGTSEKGCCSECGKLWERVIEKGLTAHDGQTKTIYPKGTTSNRLALLRQAARERGEEYANQSRTVGWKPSCSCNAQVTPCVVLDPFNGAGTTGLVAMQHGRRYVGIELNPNYLTLARRRIEKAQRQIRMEFEAGEAA